MKTLKLNLRYSLALIVFWSAASHAQAPSVIFVIDGSGSMWGKADGNSKIEIAKQGKYFAAGNAAQLVTALAEVEKEVVAPPPRPEPEPEPEPEPIQETLFEDNFDRDELGAMREIRDPDPDRFAMMSGKVLTVPTYPPKNESLLRKPFSADFIATVVVTMPLMQSNWASFNYQFDEENSIRAHFYAGAISQNCVSQKRYQARKKSFVSTEKHLADGISVNHLPMPRTGTCRSNGLA